MHRPSRNSFREVKKQWLRVAVGSTKVSIPEHLHPDPTISTEHLPCPRYCPRCQRFIELLTDGGQRYSTNHTNEYILRNKEKALRE